MKTNHGNLKDIHNSRCSEISLIKTQLFDQCGEEIWPLTTNLLNMAVPQGEDLPGPTHPGQSAVGSRTSENPRGEKGSHYQRYFHLYILWKTKT